MTKTQKRGKTMDTSKSYLSKVVKEMPDSGIKDFFDIANTMEGALSLGVGEPDFPTPEHVREAAIASIKKVLDQSKEVRQSIPIIAVRSNSVRHLQSIWKSLDFIMTGKMRS